VLTSEVNFGHGKSSVRITQGLNEKINSDRMRNLWGVGSNVLEKYVIKCDNKVYARL
jgi:hypothetical protein